MAEPKKKMTSTRSGARRSQIKLKKLSLTECKQCHTPKPPHMVCMVCGKYDGKKVLDVEKKENKVKPQEASEEASAK